ncbi:MAG: HIT domain-containing protein [candidate division Zixibacteria bacterium]|nr:HIT domain-containing protein [candidate division Zixibacteria bacterium]
MPSIFTQIINRELPAKVFYETDEVIVIRDIRSKAPVHLLIIPKIESKNFFETPLEILDLLNRTAKKIVAKLGIEDHFRIIVNNGYGQEIDHVHYHLLSDRGVENLVYSEIDPKKT